MENNRRYLVILLVVLFTSVVSFAILSMLKSERVNEQELEDYVRAYLKEYKGIVEDNFHLVHGIEHLFFKYNRNPTEICGTISLQNTSKTCWKMP